MASKTKNLKKYNKILGLEISENNLSILEIQYVKNNINVTNGFNLNIPIFQDLNNTISLIKQNLKILNIKVKDTAVGFSMQYCKLFPIPIPQTIPDDEIGSIVLQEGNIDSNTESVSWLPLANTQRQDQDGVTRRDILGISVQRSFIDLVKLITQKCGLNLISFFPSFLGLGINMPQGEINNLTATLWISQIRTELVVWSAQEPIYEHLFLTHQLNEQLFQSVNYIETQLPGSRVSKVYGFGPYYKETNLSQIPYSIQDFPLPSNILDTGSVLQRVNLSDIVYPLSIAMSASNNQLYSLPDLILPAVPSKPGGQGLKNIFKDIPKAKAAKTFKLPILSNFLKNLDPLFSKYIYASVGVIVLSLLLSLFVQYVLMPTIQVSQSTMQNRISLTQMHFNKLLNFEKTNKVLNMKVNYLSELVDKRKPWSKILREIGDMTPKDLWIDRLEVKNNNVDIFGRALTIDAVANFSINLNYTAKLVGKAQIIALRKFQEEDVDIIEFQISTKVVNSLIQESADNHSLPNKKNSNEKT